MKIISKNLSHMRSQHLIFSYEVKATNLNEFALYFQEHFPPDFLSMAHFLLTAISNYAIYAQTNRKISTFLQKLTRLCPFSSSLLLFRADEYDIISQSHFVLRNFL